MLGLYVAFILLIAFEPQLLGTRISADSPITWGIPMGVGLILSAFVLTGIYVQRANGEGGKGRFTATMIVAGQIKGMQPRLFMIYPEGNFIEASWDTPFFQIGETKYGRPILIRGYDRNMSFEDAVKLLMVSFDSTLKANLSVGLPLDLLVIGKDEFKPLHEHRVTADDEYFDAISSGWGNALRSAFHSLPSYSFRDDT